MRAMAAAAARASKFDRIDPPLVPRSADGFRALL